ncbi:Integrase zinc binding domain [Popillia japonica]|uniref:RNA-directed DNA polymerase n=1 Tax=Popillia japonica TaxID=7064 RepID=A0AAW1JH76_POPJA
MKNRLHYAHLGINKTIEKAKELIFWPNMIKEIKDIIQNCKICLKYQNSTPHEPLINRVIANGPWEILPVDLFTLYSKEYMLIVDSFSKFPEVTYFNNNTTAKRIIESMKEIFARHGCLAVIYSDNGPQFKSQDASL